MAMEEKIETASQLVKDRIKVIFINGDDGF